MKKIFLLPILFVFGCSIPNMVVVELESKSSTNVNGNVVFTEMNQVVTMIAEIKNFKVFLSKAKIILFTENQRIRQFPLQELLC